jgi:hypothetical protein
LEAVGEWFDHGMRTRKAEQEISQVDRWSDSHERQLHADLMQIAREEKALIKKLNDELGSAVNRS